ncbi:MAG: lytic murein transglycosylase B [Gammaproteobacteria bacterium]|nr:lytic murein transglycosylase B [Gammaproteobacteria bacterium]MBU1416707.1 lytic murein transglycosylase B [Gammaproteobacteria bacterium]
MIRLLLSAFLLFSSCALAAPEAPDPPYDERDDVRAFVAEMVERHGFDAATLLTHFRKVTPSPPVIKAITPPDDPAARSWQEYRDRFVDAKRIARGEDFWRKHEIALVRAQALYDVPAEIIVAIIGVETLYGEITGGFDVFNALTNLAFDYPPRAALFRRELEQLLLLARDERRDPWDYRGSYAGAIGYPQFLPSSIRNFAVDFDGDGRIDLSASSADAIGSVGRFLYMHGWARGEPIWSPAKVSRGDTPKLLAEGIQPRRLPAEMAQFGVEADSALQLPAALIDLTTPDAPTEYRLGYKNFYVLTRYNRSSFYASAVADLAVALLACRPQAPLAADLNAMEAPATGFR